MKTEKNSKPRALVVDDEQGVRNVVSMTLAHHGIESETAQSGNEAQGLVQANHYDVVVTDLRMPNGHGHRLASNLLEQEQRPVVVVLTGVTEPRITEDLQARGIDAIFFKPVDLDDFVSKVERLLDERRGQTSAKDGAVKSSTTGEILTGAASSKADAPAAAAARPRRWGQTKLKAEREAGPMYGGPGPRRGVVVCARQRPANTRRQRGSRRRRRCPLPIAQRASRESLRDRQRLDGAFSGFEILVRLRRQWAQVPAVLIDSAESSIADKVRSMSGVTLIPPGANVNETAQKVLSVTARHQIVISRTARELVEQQPDLPVMPRLVSRLVEYLGMTPDDLSLSELCRELSLDAKASLLLLKAANASSNGVSREIVSVHDAIRLLGVQRAVGHVLASTVTDGTAQLAKGILAEQRNGTRGAAFSPPSPRRRLRTSWKTVRARRAACWASCRRSASCCSCGLIPNSTSPS